MYRDRLQTKDIKLGLSLSLLPQFITSVFPPIIVRWELRITYFVALKKKNTHIALRHVTGNSYALCFYV